MRATRSLGVAFNLPTTHPPTTYTPSAFWREIISNFFLDLISRLTDHTYGHTLCGGQQTQIDDWVTTGRQLNRCQKEMDVDG